MRLCVKLTSAPIGALEVKLHAIIGNYDRPTDRPTDQWTDQWTNGPSNRQTGTSGSFTSDNKSVEVTRIFW